MSAIKINFDSANNPECPTIVLAKRSCVKLGLLATITNITVSDNLNSASEISFDLYKNVDGKECAVWDDVTNFKLIWCKEWDKWFEITVETNEADCTIKNITGKSLCECELSQINLYGIEINTETDITRDDYTEPTVLYNSKNEEASLLNRLMGKIPHYSIAYVSPYIADIQRTFTFDDISIYDAFQEIAEEIECLFVFDSSTNSEGKVAREISVYDLKDNCDKCGYRDIISGNTCPECGESDCITKGFGTDTTIYVDNDCLTDEIALSTDTDSIKNCFKLEAGDDLMTSTVVSLNPNGSSYLWYLNDDTRDEMSDDLREKLSEYDTKINSLDSVKYTDSSITSYNTILKKYITLDSSLELKELPSPILGYSNLIQAYYDVIDFKLYLQTELMPSVSIDNTSTVADQIKLLEALAGTEIGTVADVTSMTSTTANSYILSVAKNTINQTYYSVKIVSSAYSASTWTGTFKVTDLTDDDKTDTTNTITIKITSDYGLYVEQRIKSTINLNSDDDSDYLISLFDPDKDSSSFKAELKKHSLDNLNNYYEMCQTILDVLIELGLGNEADKYSVYDTSTDNYKEIYYDAYYSKLGYINDEISTRETELESIGLLETFILTEKTSLQESLNIENFLGKTLWSELCSFRREDTYSNSNFISDGLNNSELFERANEFYELAQDEIKNAATPQYEISTTLNNLLVIPELKGLSDYFEVGNWINMRVDDTLYKLRLISYTIDYENIETISVEFSNVTKFNDASTSLQDILNQASSAASSYDYVAHQTSQFANSAKILSEWANKGLDATNVMITNSANNQSVVYDEHGILCRQWDDVLAKYSDYQVKIINKGLYFTTDNWESVKTGIGNFIYYDPTDLMAPYKEGYGVIADTIVSNVILSNKVGIYNEANSITLEDSGLTITAKNYVTNHTGLFTIQKEVIEDDGGSSYEKMLYIDSDGNLQINGSSVEINVSSLNEKISNATIKEFLINGDFSKSGTWSTTELSSDSGTITTVSYNNTESWKSNSYISDVEVTNSYEETQALKFYASGTSVGSLSQSITLGIGTYTVEIIAATDSEDDNIKIGYSFGSESGTAKTITNDFDTYTYSFTLTSGRTTTFNLYAHSNANYYIKSIRVYCEATEKYDNVVSTLSVTTDSISMGLQNFTTGSGTTMTLDTEALRLRWSKISNYVSIENAGLYIKDSSDTNLIELNGAGLTVYDGAIKVLDKSGNSVFYTDSDSENTIFSGNLRVNLETGYDDTPAYIEIDKNGFYSYVDTDGTGTKNKGIGIHMNGRINPYLEFFYTQKSSTGSYTTCPVGAIYTDYVSSVEDDNDWIWSGSGKALKIESNETTAKIVRIIAGDTNFLEVNSSNIFCNSTVSVVGDINCTGSVYTNGGENTYSDSRLKENIIALEENQALSIIQDLTPVKYNFKNKVNKKHYGLIAQDVEQVFKNIGIDTANLALIGKPNDTKKYYSLAYAEFVPLLINAIKYQQKEIEELKERII